MGRCRMLLVMSQTAVICHCARLICIGLCARKLVDIKDSKRSVILTTESGRIKRYMMIGAGICIFADGLITKHYSSLPTERACMIFWGLGHGSRDTKAGSHNTKATTSHGLSCLGQV